MTGTNRLPRVWLVVMYPTCACTTGACTFHNPTLSKIAPLYGRFLRYAPYCESRKFKELIKGKIVDRPEIGYRFLQAVLQVRVAAWEAQ